MRCLHHLLLLISSSCSPSSAAIYPPFSPETQATHHFVDISLRPDPPAAARDIRLNFSDQDDLSGYAAGWVRGAGVYPNDAEKQEALRAQVEAYLFHATGWNLAWSLLLQRRIGIDEADEVNGVINNSGGDSDSDAKRQATALRWRRSLPQAGSEYGRALYLPLVESGLGRSGVE